MPPRSALKWRSHACLVLALNRAGSLSALMAPMLLEGRIEGPSMLRVARRIMRRPVGCIASSAAFKCEKAGGAAGRGHWAA